MGSFWFRTNCSCWEPYSEHSSSLSTSGCSSLFTQCGLPSPHHPCVFVFTLEVESELKGMDSLHVLWTIRILAVTNLQNNFLLDFWSY